jgi:protein-S-isoprenylcysteine O-methyltransferase Ste14
MAKAVGGLLAPTGRPIRNGQDWPLPGSLESLGRGRMKEAAPTVTGGGILDEGQEVKMANLVKKAVTRVLAAWIVLPLLFLATGGTLKWWEAWVYCVLILVPMTSFAIWIARRDPAFFERRFKVKEKEQAQRRIQAWGAPFLAAAFVVPGLDHRFCWSDPPPAVIIVAMVVSVGAYLVVLRVFMENRWAGRTIETSAEQKVISTGPYAIVRHPMYAGYMAMQLATPLALGSWWALIPALAVFPIIALRIENEEEVLVRDLPGYEEYRRKVRFRIIPFVW